LVQGGQSFEMAGLDRSQFDRSCSGCNKFGSLDHACKSDDHHLLLKCPRPSSPNWFRPNIVRMQRNPAQRTADANEKKTTENALFTATVIDFGDATCYNAKFAVHPLRTGVNVVV
jgi:hypothetical protein